MNHQRSVRLARLAVIATATAAAIVALPATAQADSIHEQFASPSGQIRCVLEGVGGPAPIAMCQIAQTSYAVPPGSAMDETTGQTCDAEGTPSGRDFRLDVGKPGFMRCSFSALDGGVGPWPTLDYGQTKSLGPLTCDSEASSMTCTDTSSGHFFRVSSDSYQLG